MKKSASIISSVLLIAVLVSSLAISVFATDHIDTELKPFSISAYLSGYTHIYNPRLKYNDSDMVIRITSGTNSYYYVRAVDCDASGTTFTNYTLLNNVRVEHVTAHKDILYSIDSLVYYVGDVYATFGIKSPGNPGSVGGEWAPDSSVKYTSPTE